MADGQHIVISLEAARAAGLKRYFTGTLCAHGHLSERFVSSRWCIACAGLRKKKWAKENPDCVESYNKRHYREHSIAAIARSKSWRKAHPERDRRNKRKEYHRNKTVYAVRFRNYREKNKDKVRALDRLKALRDPVRYATYKRNRKARVRNAPGKHSAADIATIFRLQKGKCAVCRMALTKQHVDHIVALAKGGSNDRKNLQLLCPPCNHTKSAKDPVDFMQSKGFLL